MHIKNPQQLETELEALELQKEKLVSTAYFLLPHQVPVFALPILFSVLLARFLYHSDIGNLPQLLGICVFFATSLSWLIIFFRVKLVRKKLISVNAKIKRLKSLD